MLQSAYNRGASEIACRIQKSVYESAKYYPDNFKYKEKIFVHRIIAEEVLRMLISGFPESSVTMDYTPEDNEQGTAVYNIDWS